MQSADQQRINGIIGCTHPVKNGPIGTMNDWSDGDRLGGDGDLTSYADEQSIRKQSAFRSGGSQPLPNRHRVM